MQDVELFDDHDLLRQSGGDGGMPPSDGWEVDTPGPTVQSVHSDEGGSEVPVPDDGTDFDLDDESFWQAWLAEIKADECYAAEVNDGHSRGQATGESPAGPRLLLARRASQMATWTVDHKLLLESQW